MAGDGAPNWEQLKEKASDVLSDLISFYAEPTTHPDPNWTEEFFTEENIDQTLREGLDQIEEPPQKNLGNKIAKKIGSNARPAGHAGMATATGVAALSGIAVLIAPSKPSSIVIPSIPGGFVAGTAAYAVALNRSQLKHRNSVYGEIYSLEDNEYNLENLFDSEETEVNSELGIAELGTGYTAVEDREATLSYIEGIMEISEKFEVGVEKDEDNPFVTLGIAGQYSEPAADYPGYERRKRLAEEIMGDEALIDEVLEGAPTEDPVSLEDQQYEFVVLGQNPDYDFITSEEPETPKHGAYEDDFRDHEIDGSTADLNEKVREERN